MGLFDSLFKRMQDPVRGQAQVVTCSPHSHGIYSNCHMQLVVQAEGVPATPVDLHDGNVHQGKWPYPGMTLPVTVDRADPTKVEVEWDEVATARERGAEQAEQLWKRVLQPHLVEEILR